MTTVADENTLKLVLPKGRIQERVLGLLSRIGLQFNIDNRSYRPVCNDAGIQVKLLKPQNIPTLISLGRHDCGFSGWDWVCEQSAQVTELLDLGFDPVQIVAATPEGLDLDAIRKDGKQLVVASEYPNLARQYLDEQQLNAVLIKTYGATEALPPEDADMIVDNTSTGSTLKRNRLAIRGVLMRSTTRFMANPSTLQNPVKAQRLAEMVMLMQSVLAADSKVLLEMNVSEGDLERLVAVLPAMRSPTVSPLYKQAGFAVKVAVPKGDVSRLIPVLRGCGATDILEYKLEKLV
jgi:ATP phosphoribosyltransferase